MKRFLIPILLLGIITARAQELPESLRFERGPVNAISIDTPGGFLIAINRSVEPEPAHLLLTHARRDIVDAARDSKAAQIHAPSASKEFLENTGQRWTEWWEKRFNYYEQQVTRWPVQDFAADQYDNDGGTPMWAGLKVKFLTTPGYTRDGGTYLIELDGKKVAFTGDLILAGGKVPDLYSFQEAIPEAKIGGYHGYAGRLADWLDSLDKLVAEQPDLIVPSRGPVIENPTETIQLSQSKARKIYSSYLSTNALHWYFGEERMNICAERVLGPGKTVDGMPLATHVDLPDWCQHIGTTKLLVSESGRGFVLDVGGARSLETLRTVLADELVTGIDGIFATHTHNDHTAAIAEAAGEFDCPVYALPEVADVLIDPGKWFLPGLSPNAVDEVSVRNEGDRMKWEEFTLTFHFFPGQMYNHGALLVEKSGHEPVLFMGDSFSPSGIDDYCLMNRNLMGEDAGYELCFQKLESLPENLWMVNQHIPHLFRFNDEEKDFLLSSYLERREMIADFVDWDHPDYAVDPQWASFYPYGQTVKAGETVSTDVRVWNHSSERRAFSVTLKSDAFGSPAPQSLELEPRKSGSLRFSFELPASATAGVHVVTADIERDDGVIERAFCETVLQIEKTP